MTTTTPATTIPDPERTELQGTTTTRTKAAKGSRSFSVILEGPAGQLRLVAQRKADGSAVAYAVQITKAAGGKKTSIRGMTTKHPNLEAARAPP
jgi:hypothetical protein